MSKAEPQKVQRLDSIPLDKTYFTEEGYLVDHPIVTSVGIFVYHNQMAPSAGAAAAGRGLRYQKPCLLQGKAGYRNARCWLCRYGKCAGRAHRNHSL